MAQAYWLCPYLQASLDSLQAPVRVFMPIQAISRVEGKRAAVHICLAEGLAITGDHIAFADISMRDSLEPLPSAGRPNGDPMARRPNYANIGLEGVYQRVQPVRVGDGHVIVEKHADIAGAASLEQGGSPA